MAFKNNPVTANLLYRFSFANEDQTALEFSSILAKRKHNLFASVTAANLIVYRAKDVTTGFKIYDAIIKCAGHYNFTPILTQALDNKWRMIHHHPTIVKTDTSEALDIVAKIKSYDKNYTSAELAIAYDLTLNDFHNAHQEYKRLQSKSKTDKQLILASGYSNQLLYNSYKPLLN